MTLLAIFKADIHEIYEFEKYTLNYLSNEISHPNVQQENCITEISYITILKSSLFPVSLT